MAHIKKMTDKHRTLPFRAQVKRKGHPTLIKMFQTRAQAQRWAYEQEKSILEMGLPLTIEHLRKHTVGEIVSDYLAKVTPHKGSHVSEAATLNKFLRYDICKKSLAAIKPKDAYDYIALRRKETWRDKPIKNSTIRRDINSISNVFVVAKKEWGYENLTNPFAGIKLKGSINRRERRLKPGELKKLQQACERCLGLNRLYVPLAIHLAVDTGMRLQEILNLTWQDIDGVKRRIKIRKSKTDHVSEFKGRTIVCPFWPMAYLGVLRASLMAQAVKALNKEGIPPTGRIFPMTTEAFKQSWADVRKRAKIADLTFHDLRHEAGSMFDEAGLTKAEHDLMMGHANNDMTSRYIHSDLKNIQDKLDRHLFNGKTLDEIAEHGGPVNYRELADAFLGKRPLADVFFGKSSQHSKGVATQLFKNVVPFTKPGAG
jgi:integrase